MIISHLIAKNWRNFQQIDVRLSERQFIVGANASGKSNLLDIFRFLRDIVKAEGGGFQKAVKDRGGVSLKSAAWQRGAIQKLQLKFTLPTIQTLLQLGNMDSDFAKKLADTAGPISLMNAYGKMVNNSLVGPMQKIKRIKIDSPRPLLSKLMSMPIFGK